MAYQSGKPILREIAALAAGQGGYFTTRQAYSLGYDRRRLAYHVSAGNFERVDQGLYRLPSLPASEHDDLVRAAFWSRDSDDSPQATVSHRTALALHNLGDLFAGSIHLTVPPGFRKRPPIGWSLHRAELNEADREEREGFYVTTPARTLLDVSSRNDIDDEELTKAVRDALELGLVRRKQIEHAAAQRNDGRLTGIIQAARNTDRPEP